MFIAGTRTGEQGRLRPVGRLSRRRGRSPARARRRRLRRAPTEHACRHLALETEARLLGETAAWHARRAVTGIA
jgi:hypothetical protein